MNQVSLGALKEESAGKKRYRLESPGSSIKDRLSTEMKEAPHATEKPASGAGGSAESEKINSLLAQLGQKGSKKNKVWAQRSKSINDYQKYVSAKNYNPKITQHQSMIDDAINLQKLNKNQDLIRELHRIHNDPRFKAPPKQPCAKGRTLILNNQQIQVNVSRQRLDDRVSEVEAHSISATFSKPGRKNMQIQTTLYNQSMISKEEQRRQTGSQLSALLP